MTNDKEKMIFPQSYDQNLTNLACRVVKAILAFLWASHIKVFYDIDVGRVISKCINSQNNFDLPFIDTCVLYC